MKKSLTLFVICIALTAIFAFNSPDDEKEIEWKSFEEVEKLQKENPKPVFIDVFAYWCKPCMKMDKTTFHEEEIVQYVNDNFYAIKLDFNEKKPINYKGKTYTDMGKYHALAKEFEATFLPTTLFMNENQEVVLKRQEQLQKDDMMAYLKYVAEGHYTDMSLQEYLKTID